MQGWTESDQHILAGRGRLTCARADGLDGKPRMGLEYIGGLDWKPGEAAEVADECPLYTHCLLSWCGPAHCMNGLQLDHASRNVQPVAFHVIGLEARLAQPWHTPPLAVFQSLLVLSSGVTCVVFLGTDMCCALIAKGMHYRVLCSLSLFLVSAYNI